MRTVVVHQLSPNHGEAWTFHLEPLARGRGIVSVPSVQGGYPIDWPPESPPQAAWLRALVPRMKARAGSAWCLSAKAWARLLATLDAQAAAEQPSGASDEDVEGAE